MLQILHKILVHLQYKVYLVFTHVMNIYYVFNWLLGGTHEDTGGVEDIQDSVNESTPSTQGIMY